MKKCLFNFNWWTSNTLVKMKRKASCLSNFMKKSPEYKSLAGKVPCGGAVTGQLTA